MSSFKSGTERPTRHPRRRPSGKGRARVQAFVCRRGFFHASAQAARLRTPTRGSMRRASGPDRSDCTHSKRKGVCMNDAGTVKSVCMDAGEIERSLTRIAHQILEANKGADGHRGRGHRHPGRSSGARSWPSKIEEIEGTKVPLGKLDISFYRDDFATYITPGGAFHRHPLRHRRRHGRAGGRRAVHRAHHPRGARRAHGHRPPRLRCSWPCWWTAGIVELPIRADYVGKNVPSSA